MCNKRRKKKKKTDAYICISLDTKIIQNCDECIEIKKSLYIFLEYRYQNTLFKAVILKSVIDEECFIFLLKLASVEQLVRSRLKSFRSLTPYT